MFFTTIEEWVGLALAAPVCVWSGLVQAKFINQIGGQ